MSATPVRIGDSKDEGAETNTSTSITVGAGVVPPDGASVLQPWFGGEPFAMAGVWSEATNPKTGEIVDSYAIVTTQANALIRLHDRMPVILAPESYSSWLEPSELPKSVLRPFPENRLTGWRVPDEARNARTGNNPRLIECSGPIWPGV